MANIAIRYMEKNVSQTDRTADALPINADAMSPLPVEWIAAVRTTANRIASIAGKYSARRFIFISAERQS